MTKGGKKEENRNNGGPGMLNGKDNRGEKGGNPEQRRAWDAERQ